MSEIETTIKYEKATFIEVAIGKDALDILDAHPFVRTDYHEDGTSTRWYGFEIDEKKYKHYLALAEIGAQK